MSFSTALSGLNAASADLNVKSNNIANVNTTGFKESRAEFGDVFAVSAFGSTSNTAVGNGVVLQNVAQQFNQGNLEFTDNSLDLAISGEGFFAMAPDLDSDEVIYTRAGQFGINKDGYIVNSQGNYLKTFPVDANGNISATSINATNTIQLPPSAGAPEATTLLSLATNLPSNAKPISDSTGAVAAIPGSDDINFSNLISVNDTVTVKGVTFEFTNSADAPTVNTSTSVRVNINPAGTQQDAVNAFVTAFTAAVNDSAGTGSGSKLQGLSASNTGSIVKISDSKGGLATTVGRTVTASNAAVVQNVSGADAITGPVLPINPLDPNTYTKSTSAPIYDSLGNEHIVTTYYQKIDSKAGNPEVGDNQWQMEVYISSNDIKVVPGVTPLVSDGTTSLVKLGPTTRMSFNDDGTFNNVAGTSPVELRFNPASGTELSSGAADQNFNLSLLGSTQNSGAFAVNSLSVNGFATGRLTGVDVSEDGLVRAAYSNGQKIPIGKIALANFPNVQALNKLGNTTWKETSDSGPVVAGEAGTGSFGKIQAGALETSNVDLTAELVGLITAQRNFQANSKAIETNNAITQTIINLR